MGDKLDNILIIFIMIVILGLGSIYYVKNMGSDNYTLNDSIGYSEQISSNTEAIPVNTNITNDNIVGNRATIEQNTNTSVNNNSYKTSNQKGYIYNNRHYYNSLNEYSKVIYDAIVNNLDNIMKGNLTIDVDYDFSTLLNNSNGQEELNDYYDDAVNAVNLDVPNLFYIDFSKMYLNIEKSKTLFSTKYKLYLGPGNYANYYADEFISPDQVQIAVNQVENVKNQVKSFITGSDYYKIKKLHDWIVDYMYYDMSSGQRASVYGALIEKKGVCESYARAYKYILDELGIENVLVTGSATNSTGDTEDHMWNYVKLDGTWYAVDVTWDDPVVIGGGTPSAESRYRYFLMGSQELFKNHVEKLTISSSGRVFSPPRLSVDNY